MVNTHIHIRIHNIVCTKRAIIGQYQKRANLKLKTKSFHFRFRELLFHSFWPWFASDILWKFFIEYNELHLYTIYINYNIYWKFRIIGIWMTCTLNVLVWKHQNLTYTLNDLIGFGVKLTECNVNESIPKFSNGKQIE